jgi:hypothetical protein
MEEEKYRKNNPVRMSALSGDAPCLKYFLTPYLLGDLIFNTMLLEWKYGYIIADICNTVA